MPLHTRLPDSSTDADRRDLRQEFNNTADRLVLDVVAAHEDGCSAVPESGRLIAWLSAEFLPCVTPTFPQPPQDLRDLQDVLEQLHGSHGSQAVQLSLQARSLVFRLL